MTRYWKFKAKNADGAVDVYVATSLDAIEHDLKADPDVSLILGARSHAADSDESDDTNHRHLAKGTFDQHMKREGYRGAKSFEEVSELPTGTLSTFGYGGYQEGDNLRSAVIVYES